MRNAGDVTYADAHKKVRNEAYVFEFDCCGGAMKLGNVPHF